MIFAFGYIQTSIQLQKQTTGNKEGDGNENRCHEGFC